MSYLERLKNRESGEVSANKQESPEENHGQLQRLLREVGAKIEPGPRIVFNPYLAGPRVDRERWDKAVELEGIVRALHCKGEIQ
jgi:hypothetical protein